MDEDRARYLDIEQMVKRELRDAERVYVNGILQNGLESGNNKPFWKYVKSQKQETFGISALKSNSNVITDSLSKAEILNSQFKSVFTPQSGNTFPQLSGTQFPKIKSLHISENGVLAMMWKEDVREKNLDGVFMEKNVFMDTCYRMTQTTPDKSEVVKWKLKIDKDIKEEDMYIIMSTTEISHLGLTIIYVTMSE